MRGTFIIYSNIFFLYFLVTFYGIVFCNGNDMPCYALLHRYSYFSLRQRNFRHILESKIQSVAVASEPNEKGRKAGINVLCLKLLNNHIINSIAEISFYLHTETDVPHTLAG